MIFYFSGTGNTKWVAQQLAEATGETLYYIPDELRKGELCYTLQPGERLGFCFPTHGWQPPRIVREFISRGEWLEVRGKRWELYLCGDDVWGQYGVCDADSEQGTER